MALALSAGATKSAAYSALQSTTRASMAPAARARWRRVSGESVAPWPTSAARAITSTPFSSISHRTATEVSSPPE